MNPGNVLGIFLVLSLFFGIGALVWNGIIKDETGISSFKRLFFGHLSFKEFKALTAHILEGLEFIEDDAEVVNKDVYKVNIESYKRFGINGIRSTFSLVQKVYFFSKVKKLKKVYMEQKRIKAEEKTRALISSGVFNKMVDEDLKDVLDSEV